MSFKKIELQAVYDSGEDDVINDFYIPILRESIEYWRLTGYFSSTSLAIAAKGIRGLLENDGIMKLVSGAVLRRKDVKAIKEGKESPEKVIERIVLNDFDTIESEFIKNHVSALAWLVANEKLVIKIAIVKDDLGFPIDVETLESSGIFHQKVGIFKEQNGDMIAFSGSVNETAFGWEKNIEEFNVFRSWVNEENKYFRKHYEKFEKYWEGSKDNVEIINAPDAIKKRLIKMAPAGINKLNLEYTPQSSLKTQKTLTPWPHQKKAINAFMKNNYRGIFKMATGTGKTFNALLALDRFFINIQKYQNRIIIIAPQHNLVKQWVQDLIDFLPPNDFILPYDSKTSEKRRRFARNVWMHKFAKKDKFNIILVITIGSIIDFKPIQKYLPDVIIGDEVHTYGTFRNIEILDSLFSSTKYRLGLSATPERYYDSDGTERILKFFGPIVYEYSIQNAQKDEVLSKYHYYPYIVYLTPTEEDLLEDITSRIRKKAAIKFTDELSEKEDSLDKEVKRLIMNRAKIFKRAEEKLLALKEILQHPVRKIQQCIVYSLDSEQLEKIRSVFYEQKIESYIKYHSKIKNREDALTLFKKNNCKYILSINCLDQGVNIPSCESLILLSSSGNPREYIQRRGRVLRKPKNIKKPMVQIYDIFAFPRNSEKMYREIVITQLLRAWSFINCSETPEAKIIFQNILNDYEISNTELESLARRF